MAKEIFNIRNMYFAEGIPVEEIPEEESGDLMYNILGNTNLEKVLMWNFGVSRNAAKQMVHEILKIRRYYHTLKEQIEKEADEWSDEDA